MTKASDNVYPRLLISEGGSTATPAAARVTIYAKADGLLYSKDDAGAETALGGGGGDITTDAAWAAKGDLIVGTANNTAAVLTAGTNGKVLMAASGEATGLKWETPAAGTSLAMAVTVQDAAADYTTNGTSFADIDATNLSATITTGAHRVKVTLAGHLQMDSGSGSINLDVYIDSARLGGTNGSANSRKFAAGTQHTTFTFISPALSAGEHTIKMQWRCEYADGTATLTRKSGQPLYFIVEELPL